jgi:hypothetical protein
MAHDQASASVPREPTLEMCVAYMKASGFRPSYVKQWTAYLEKHLGGPNECSFVVGLRAAIAVGAGLPLGQVKRGFRPHNCFTTHLEHRK